MVGAIAIVATVSACGDSEPDAGPEVPANDYCAPVDNWDSELAAFEVEVLVLVNEARAEGAICGTSDVYEPAPALSMDPALRCAARIHALDMATQDYFSNLDPEGLRYSDRAAMAGYEAFTRGQNIGAAHSSPEQLVVAVLGSPGLCRTLMDPDATDFGMGRVFAEGVEHSSYWTQVYGGPTSASDETGE